jgi:NAD(P)-dependent dehydrogenase (short-subunit alcohol dehydrogenase family)
VEDLERVFSVNVRGVFLCYKYAAEQMIAQGRGGRIIGELLVYSALGLCRKTSSQARLHAQENKVSISASRLP